MNDSSLKAALRKLLAHGEVIEDKKLMGMAAKKNAPPAEMCPKCGAPMSEGVPPEPDKCPKCGYVKADAEDGGENEMAGLLEQGSEG